MKYWSQKRTQPLLGQKQLWSKPRRHWKFPIYPENVKNCVKDCVKSEAVWVLNIWMFSGNFWGNLRPMGRAPPHTGPFLSEVKTAACRPDRTQPTQGPAVTCSRRCRVKWKTRRRSPKTRPTKLQKASNENQNRLTTSSKVLQRSVRSQH